MKFGRQIRRHVAASALLMLVLAARAWAGADIDTEASSGSGPNVGTSARSASVLAMACPPSQSVTSAIGGAVAVSYAAPMATGGSQPVTISSSPVSGSSFPTGWTTVVARASSADGQTVTCTFSISVMSSLVLSSVPNQTATSADGDPVRVAFPAPTIAGGIEPYSAITCYPASGSLFPVGTTTETCRVSDGESPPATALSTFSVTVTPEVGSLTIAWDGNVFSGDVTEFQILYGTASGRYFGSLNTGTLTTGTLTGLTRGTTYYVVVRAFNGFWSDNSAEIVGTP